MKGYMDATTSLTNFLKAFESALEQRCGICKIL
jgi:hypothetical protein